MYDTTKARLAYKSYLYTSLDQPTEGREFVIGAESPEKSRFDGHYAISYASQGCLMASVSSRLRYFRCAVSRVDRLV